MFRFAPDWKEEHVLSHLADARGILQADGYKGYKGYKGYAKLYVPEANDKPRLREAVCWAHLRRDFHDFWVSAKSEIAREALDQIGKLYDIERDINGQPADVRNAAREKAEQTESRGLLCLVRTAAPVHSWQERSGQGLPLWSEPSGRIQPLPK